MNVNKIYGLGILLTSGELVKFRKVTGLGLGLKSEFAHLHLLPAGNDNIGVHSAE